MTSELRSNTTNPDAEAVFDDFCCIHHAVHPFELVHIHSLTRMVGATLESGKPAEYCLRSPYPCSIQRPVDPNLLEADPGANRWDDRLEVEATVDAHPDWVPEEVRREMLLEVLTELDWAMAIPEARANRCIARVLTASASFFGVIFVLTLITHWVPFAYLSILGLAATVLSPFAAKAVYTHLWRRQVRELIPDAVDRFVLSRTKIKKIADGACLKRIHRQL